MPIGPPSYFGGGVQSTPDNEIAKKPTAPRTSMRVSRRQLDRLPSLAEDGDSIKRTQFSAPDGRQILIVESTDVKGIKTVLVRESWPDRRSEEGDDGDDGDDVGNEREGTRAEI
eukprot:CAMPEP_0113594750 /NCGR_PEP_ID=MMETSP0015_2-20120614/39264_1 /TAXON_ID=2838 /ORGANISM="Odontella" /LENGTH=113 /DNA_ID=CAMNT_0000501809 /DNA_START=168 /DNA_END=509 /DNA_ORIENTATION=- /assembly_acc=CAM_ASM_000160